MWFILTIGSCSFVTAQQQGPFAVQSNGVSISFQNSGGIATSSDGVSIAFQNSGGIAASSGGVSIAFQNSGGIASSSGGVSIAFQNASNSGYVGSQGVTIGFETIARQLQVTPLNPIQRGTVQAVGSNFTPDGNVTLYLTDPNNVTRVVGSGVVDGLGQVTVNYTTLCSDLTGYNAFRMLDAASGTYSNSYTINIAPDVTGCSVISGTVTYGNAASPPKYISNVTVAGTGSMNVFTTTAAPGGTAGQYALTGFGSGSYTVSLSKTTGQNGISSQDAAMIARHVAGIQLFTSDARKVAADVTNNGSLSSTDAAQIARFVAGFGVGTTITNQWRFFVPPGPTFPVGASPTSRTYSSITSNITGDDYVGLLIGEVTGNWTPSAARPSGGGAAKDEVIAERKGEAIPHSDGQSPKTQGPERGIEVELPQIGATFDKETVIPVSVRDIADKGVISYEFNLRYDPLVLQPLGDAIDLKGTVSRGLSVVTNATEPGLLRVVVYGPLPIDENGILLNLRFTAVGAVGSVSPLTFERIIFNEGEPRISVASGEVRLF